MVSKFALSTLACSLFALSSAVPAQAGVNQTQSARKSVGTTGKGTFNGRRTGPIKSTAPKSSRAASTAIINARRNSGLEQALRNRGAAQSSVRKAVSTVRRPSTTKR